MNQARNQTHNQARKQTRNQTPTDTPALRIANITAGYGRGAAILHELSLEVRARQIVTIIGPNGAGKSTAMKAAFGLLNIHAGHIYLGARKVTGAAPNQMVEYGVGYVPQVFNIFPEMRVDENLEMGAFLRPALFEASRARVYDLFPDLKQKADTPAGKLSGGQRQMVAIGRALMLEPDMLLLDEPTAGLSPKYMMQIFELIQSVRESGVSILLVEQHAKQALAFSDYAYVLTSGKNRMNDSAEALLANPEVGKLFLGA